MDRICFCSQKYWLNNSQAILVYICQYSSIVCEIFFSIRRTVCLDLVKGGDILNFLSAMPIFKAGAWYKQWAKVNKVLVDDLYQIKRDYLVLILVDILSLNM